MGDPAGIGPEIAVRAMARPGVRRMSRPLLFGDPAVIRKAAAVTGVTLPVVALDRVADATFAADRIEVVDCARADLSRLEYGKVLPEAGLAAYHCVEAAIQSALDGEVDATVTAPLHKEALQAAGVPYPGHTEIYAALTGTRDYAMMLADGDFRVIHVSTHVSLREACDRVTQDRVYRTILLARDAMLRLGIASPRIGVAGLNPHAGENGLFGDEEILYIAPAVRQAVAEGIDADGPLPPDSAFSRARGGRYDIMVAMYHDQGHIPIKTAGFVMDRKTGRWKSVSGINVTLGLPIIRTSVDHGTAFDQAGMGTASDRSMVEAIRYAVQLSRTAPPRPPEPTRRALRTLLADDLTGALDTGMQLAERTGSPVACVWDPDAIDSVPRDGILIYDTESRNQTGDLPAPSLDRALAALSAAGRRIDYLKIDSTLRGPVVPTLGAVLESGEHPGALVCPALPAQGRTVQAGQVLLDNVPLPETDIGQDPLSPSDGALLPQFVARWGQHAVASGTAQDLPQALARGARIFFADAKSDADLRRLAETAAEYDLLPVGSAGLAAAWPAAAKSNPLPTSPRLPGPLVFLCGSPAQRSRDQVARVLEDRPDLVHLHPARAALTAPDGSAARAAMLTSTHDDLNRALREGKDVLLDLVHVSKDRIVAAEGSPQTARVNAARILSSLQAWTEPLSRAGTVVLLGGDTAMAALRFAGAEAVELAGGALPQIPYGKIRGGQWDGKTIVTKAGGFGDPDALLRLIDLRA